MRKFFTLLFILFYYSLHAQQTHLIKGVVLSSDDKSPLPGATIRQKGTDLAIVSGQDGRFMFLSQHPAGSLIVSYIGYQTREVVFDAAKPVSIMLHPEGRSLDEVVLNAGYYETSRKLSTGNIVKIDSSIISRQPVSNPLAALHGRVPGLVVNQSSGIPGAGISVQLRGQASLLQGTDPLFVIDGVPFSAGNTPMNSVASAAGSGGSSGLSPLNMINPSDIESIEVLKDADATSIYGSRGANGVILITTKKAGIPGQQFTFNLSSGYSKVTRTMDMLDTRQYIQMRKEAFKNDGTELNTLDAPDLLLWDTTRYTNFKDLLIGGTANFVNGFLSLEGGNQNTKYNIGGELYRETTVFPGSEASARASAHLALNYTSPDKRLSVNSRVNYSHNTSNLTGADLTAYINTPPNMLLYDANGKPNWEEGGVYYLSLITNPIAMTYNTYDGVFQNMIGNLTASYRIVPNLNVKVNAGYNFTDGDNSSKSPSASINPDSGTKPFANFGKNHVESWIVEPQISYQKELFGGTSTWLLGGTWQSQTGNNLSVVAQNYANDLLLGSVAAAGNTFVSNNDFQYRYASVYGRINYNFRDTYILNLTGRRDGSSRFGPGKQYADFGAVGVAWIFSNEEFASKFLPFVYSGKIRASLGVTGNDQIGNYRYFNTYTNALQPYQGVPGLTPTALYNPDFAWETNRKAEVSLDLGFADGKISMSAAYFNNRSGNQLINYSLPIQTGFPSVLRNLNAEIENSGVEVMFNSTNISSKSFGWTTSFNISRLRNKLIAFPGLETSSYANSYIIGKPLSTKKVYQYLGVDKETGIYSFNDIDGDGSFTSADRIILKNTQPDFFGGIENLFNYKRMQLSVFFEFKKQTGLNYLYTQSSYIPGYYYINQPVAVLSRWQKPGDETGIQRFAATGESAAFQPAYDYLANSEAVYGDASYIRLKNVQIAWNLGRHFLSTVKAKSIRAYIQGQNLLTITSYTGSDPENQNLFVLPPLRTLSFGLQVSF